MNIKHLEHLLALADCGSFSRAADKLFITQSALSIAHASSPYLASAAQVSEYNRPQEQIVTPSGE